MAGNNDTLNLIKIVDNVTIATGVPAALLTIPIDLSTQKIVGNITLQIQVTGTGTLTTDFLVSNSYSKSNPTGDFVKAVSGFNIAALSTFTVTSGTDSDGKDHANIPMNNAQAFKLLFTATTNPVTLSAWLSLQ